MPEQTEQKFGLEGIEQSQGYQPMGLADAPPAEAADADQALTNLVESRPDPAPVVERQFIDVQSGEPMPANQTLSAEDAARNLARTRQAEADTLAEYERAAIAGEADRLRGEAAADLKAQWDAHNVTEQQPTQSPQPDAQPQQTEQQPAGSSRLEQLLQSDPALLGEVQGYTQQVHVAAEQAIAQRTQAADAAVARAAQFAAWNANLAAQAILADIPELQNVNPAEIGTAIQTIARMNPQRAQVIVGKIKSLEQLALQSQNAQAAQTQAQRRQMAAWMTEQDQIFDAHFTKLLPGVDRKTVSQQAPQTLRDAGIDDATMRRLYNESDVFRSSSAQVLMAKAAAWDAYQKDKSDAAHALRNQRNNPLQHVVKPGTSNSFTRGYEEATRLPQQFSSAKEASEWLTANRRRNAR
jgi:hypothetical protein